jgi:DNA-binding response OmpR family regulator
MPGAIDGIALAAHVRAAMPDVPIIYTTGRPDALRRAGPLELSQFLVRKPYLPSDILDRARALLPAPKRGHAASADPPIKCD